MKVQSIMSKNPVFVRDDEFITRARQLIRDSHFRSLPVIDDAHKVTGMITEEGVLKITSTKSNVTVKGFTRYCPIVTPLCNIRDAAMTMVNVKMGGLPVVRSSQDRELLGMITRQDIIRSGCARSGKEAPPVEKIMSTHVYSVTPEDTIKEAVLMMMKHDIGRLPVEK